ncbi:MAG: redoxin domain-containing protein [Acidobacteriota bacterium]
MRIKGIIFFALLGAVVLAGLYNLATRYGTVSAGPHIEKLEGARPVAPDITLTSLDGSPINLEDYRGKVVLLNFWATWCGPCRMEIPGLEDLQRRYGYKGLRVIGMDEISEDNVNAVRRFYQQFQMNYPVVLASDRVGNLYGGIYGTPTSILIGCDGRIDGKFVGYTDESFFVRKINTLLTACPSG